MRKLRIESGLVLVGFGAANFLLRFALFSRSVIDWDESLFLLMGRAILRGDIPYSTVWEHSPVGGPLLFAAAQWLFGESVPAIRVFTWLTVSLTCWLLYILANDLAGRGRIAGSVAGLCYAVYSLNNYGQAAHRELFFAPLVTLAVWLLLRRRAQTMNQPGRHAAGTLLAAGFLMGAGLQLKYLYIWDWAGIAVIAALFAWVGRKGALRSGLFEAARAITLLAVGPVALVGVVALYFALTGHFEDYMLANFTSGVTYIGQERFQLWLLAHTLQFQTLTNILPWLGLFLTPVYLAVARDQGAQERRTFLYVAIWFLFALVDAVFTRRLFGHYFLQVLPPLCVLSGLVVAGAVGGPQQALATRQRAFIVALILLGPLVPRAYPEALEGVKALHQRLVAGQPAAADMPAQVADYVRQRVRPGEAILVVDYEPIVYYLVDAEAPTRYLFTPHLVDEFYSLTDGIDQPAEMDAAFAKMPVYVVRQVPKNWNFSNAVVEARVEAHLQRDYVLETGLTGTGTFSDTPITVEIYRLKNE